MSVDIISQVIHNLVVQFCYEVLLIAFLAWYDTLKTDSRYPANFFVTDGPGDCHNDNLRCTQRRQTLNRKYRLFGEIFITDGTAYCHFSNFRATSDQNFIKIDKISVSTKLVSWQLVVFSVCYGMQLLKIGLGPISLTIFSIIIQIWWQLCFSLVKILT